MYSTVTKPATKQLYRQLRLFHHNLSSSFPIPAKRDLINCNSQITEHGRAGNIRAAESIFHRMPTKNIVSYTAMLTAYSQNGELGNARRLFDEMPERSVASWNAMITGCIRRKHCVDEGFRLFMQMPERNARSFAAMITGFVNSGRLDEAERLYGDMPLCFHDPACSNVMMKGYLKAGRLDKAVLVFDEMVEKDVVSWSSMVDGYCKNDRVDEARNIFDAMTDRNEVTWSAMINGYMKQGRLKDGFGLFLEMRMEGDVRIEPIVVTSIFEACGRWDRYKEGCQVHGLILHLGFGFDVFLGNSVITMYSRFGCVHAARSMFDEMLERDIFSWNSLIFCYVQDKNLEEAYQIFQRAPEKDVVSWTIMIIGYSDRNRTEECIKLFNMMSEKDAVAWASLISGFVNNGKHQEAIRWFTRMLKNEVRPNPTTLITALMASSSLANLNQGSQVHAHVIKRELESDLAIQNTLVSFYSKCGCINDAYLIFTTIKKPNIVSFNSMISGYAQNGLGSKAIDLFEEVINNGYEPTKITFLGVLSACAHVGLVEEGRKYFSSMKSLYNIEPVPDHYACMVDLLGKSGLLDEAVVFINSMPFSPHSGIWGALLAASSTHSRLDLAELAAKKISELEPENAAPYVLLSDMYSFAGKKSDENQVRKAKNLKGIRKFPGSSRIDMVN